VNVSDINSLSIDRSELERLEAQMLECLLLGADVPPNVDSRKAAESARVLSCKRKRSIERAYPAAVESLGNVAFDRIFAEYITRYPGLHPLGAWHEAMRFRKFMSLRSGFLLRRLLSLLDNIVVFWGEKRCQTNQDANS